MNLSAIGQELYNLTNKNEKHPLTKYIIAIDENWDDDSLLRAIGERIGIYIDEDEYAPYILYFVLKNYLIQNIDLDRTQYIIDILKDDYENLYPSLAYSNRLVDYLTINI
jgi:hypothetical protein